MNSERRHELQENELASVIDRINAKIEPYSKPIAALVAIAFIGLLGWGFYSSLQAEHRSDATYQLIEGSVRGDSETLATVAATYPKTPMAAWARLYQGSQKMGAGINSLFTSRDEAEELLTEASAAYQEALSLSQDTLIQSRAHYGLARIAESLGKTDEAIAHYEATMDAGESVEMMTESQQRIKLLSKPAAKNFLTWFDEQDFTPADPSLPPALPSDQMLPDLPDLDFPDLGLSGPPATESPQEEAMDEAAAVQTETAEKAAQTPASEKPADEKAVEEKPIAEAKPSGETSAGEKAALEKPTETPADAEEPAADAPPTESPAMTEETSPPATEPAVESAAPPAEPASEKPAPAEPAAEKPAAEKPAAEKPAPEATSDDSGEAVDLVAPSNS